MLIREKSLNSYIAKLLKNNVTIQQFNNSFGFTLIELLVVISIIAILVASATVSWRNAQMKSRDGKRKADLKAVQQALEIYLKTYGLYPDHSSGGKIRCDITGDRDIKEWGEELSCDENGSSAPAKIIFMTQLPKDPVFTASSDRYYFQRNTNTTYTLSAKIENANDPDIAPGALVCTPASGHNYCVVSP